MADEEAEKPAYNLEGSELPGEAVLAEGPAPDQPQVQDGEVARLLEALLARLLVDAGDDLEQAQLPQHADDRGDGPRGLPLGRPGGDGGLEQPRAGVEPGQAVARAGDDVEELGRRVEEVGDLGDQQQHEGLAKVAQDADDDEDHAREVAEGVADEDAGRVLVVREEGEADAQEGQEEVQAEQMAVHGGVRVLGREVEGVVEDQQQRDDDGLHDLDPVDAGQDVDGVGAEDGTCRHVEVVEDAEIDQLLAHEGLERDGEDDGGNAEIDKVDDQEGDRGEGGDEELVPPADVEEVVADSEDGDGLKREYRGEEGGELLDGARSVPDEFIRGKRKVGGMLTLL